GNAAPHLRPDLDPGHVAEAHRDAVGARTHRNEVEVFQRAQIARGANHVFGLAHFDDGAAGFAIGGAYRFRNALLTHTVWSHALGIEDDLVLSHHAADRSDFGDARHTLQFEAQQPVLEAAQLSKIMLTGAVDKGVLEDPTDASCVGA